MTDTLEQVHVGIISMGYPPLKHVAGLRAGRFAQELVDLGARVTVYTTSSPDQPAHESDNDDRLRVIRAPSRAMTLGLAPPSGSPVARRAKTAVRMFGDGAFGEWVQDIVRIVEAQGPSADHPDVLWAIHGLDSTHALARRLSHHLGVPWVADYKDNWDFGKTGAARVAAYVAHRRRTSSAVLYTAASRIGARHLRKVFGRHAVPIYTGVDVGLWEQSPPADLGPRFNIVFTGHAVGPAMSTDIAAAGLVKALEALPKGTVDVHYFGHTGEWLRQRLASAGLEAAFVDHGFADRTAVACAQKGADLLLYLPYVRVPLICVKFFEYLASGRPVLSVPEERDDWGAGEGVFAARTVGDVTRRVVGLVRRWEREGALTSYARDMSKYEWRPQAEHLYALMTGLTAAGAPRQKVGPS
ncbi:MAG: hypothetical protein ACR2KK_06660 [Acidimicrobiales bacterium]